MILVAVDGLQRGLPHKAVVTTLCSHDRIYRSMAINAVRSLFDCHILSGHSYRTISRDSARYQNATLAAGLGNQRPLLSYNPRTG